MKRYLCSERNLLIIILYEKNEKVGGKERTKYNFKQSTKTSNYSDTLQTGNQPSNYDDLRYPSSVRHYNNRSRGNRGLHPNQKPVELLEYLVQTYTKENDTVLDFTMGSGTCGVACLNTNRDFIGIELEKKYYDIATERLKNYQTRLI